MELTDRFYKSPEVAKILGVSLRTLYRYMESGKINSIRLPSGRHRFTKEQIENFLYANNDIPMDMPKEKNNINVGHPAQQNNKQKEETQNYEEVRQKETYQESTTYQPFSKKYEEELIEEPKEEVEKYSKNTKTIEEEKKENEVVESKEREEDKDADLEAELERLLASLEEDEDDKIKDETVDEVGKTKINQPQESSKLNTQSSIIDFEEPQKEYEEKAFEEEPQETLDENKVMYFYCPYNELRRIARIVEKTAKDSNKDYAFTMNAGLSLFFPLDPFSIIHFYINEDDLDFWKENLQLKESSQEEANIGILLTRGSAFNDVREVSGLRVVNKERLIQNLKANGLENLVEEAEEKL